MFQKELADKIIAVYPSPNYGRISILSNYRLNFIKKILVSTPDQKILSNVNKRFKKNVITHKREEKFAVTSAIELPST